MAQIGARAVQNWRKTAHNSGGNLETIGMAFFNFKTANSSLENNTLATH
jgi:hypothetical protein